MPDLSNEIILHNYPQSPVAEKVRVAFGIKNVSWHDVEIPRLTPKPNLTELTGGYRRTPVMQIGADIYCDSQCIIRELNNRYPADMDLSSQESALMWCLSRWTDGALFDLSVKLVLGSAGDNLPRDFAEDRGRLYLGPDWAEGLKRANAQLPHLVAQMRTPFLWLDRHLGDGRTFIAGDAASAIDAQFYHVVWFVRGRFAGGPGMLSEFSNLLRWEEIVRALGHGPSTSMSPEKAIEIARDSDSSVTPKIADNEPQDLAVGTQVTVHPDVDGGEQGVSGKIVRSDAETVIVERISEKAGRVCVHFPRTGYRVDID